jgi:hypothetical protein
MGTNMSFAASAGMLGFVLLCGVAFAATLYVLRRRVALPSNLIGVLLGALLCFILIEALPALI